MVRIEIKNKPIKIRGDISLKLSRADLEDIRIEFLNYVENYGLIGFEGRGLGIGDNQERVINFLKKVINPRIAKELEDIHSKRWLMLEERMKVVESKLKSRRK